MYLLLPLTPDRKHLEVRLELVLLNCGNASIGRDTCTLLRLFIAALSVADPAYASLNLQPGTTLGTWEIYDERRRQSSGLVIFSIQDGFGGACGRGLNRDG